MQEDINALVLSVKSMANSVHDVVLFGQIFCIALSKLTKYSSILGKPPPLGRSVVCKNQNKSFKAYLAISRDFPIDFVRLLDVLEVVAPFKHFNKLREFVQLKLPPGFPVQIEIPIFPTIVAKVTFQVRMLND